MSVIELGSSKPTPAAPNGAGGRACIDCKWSVKSPNDIRGVARECHVGPPAAHLVPTAQGPGFLTAFPTVQPDQWCGRFEPPALH